jgi:SAM-dependent methyltransferase
MQRVHGSAAVGFDRAAAAYERGRPDYPAPAVAKLADELAIASGREVLDLAAGTGKLTRALVPLGAALVAVEPVPGMREQLQRSVPQARVLDGTAERIPLEDGSVDAVVVAQAFHWFDAAAATAEIHRVLRPNGGLGVIWNSWDERVGWVARVQCLVHEYVHGAPQQRTSPWARRVDDTGLFAPLQDEEFPNVVRGDLDTLLARVASVSYIAALDQTEREGVLAGVAAIVNCHPATRGRDELEMPYVTHVAWARRAGSE